MQEQTPSRPLAIGFIGGALNSAVGYAHYASCQMDNRWSVAAGCFSRHWDVNRDTGQAYGVAPERVYHTWQDMLQAEKGRLDAVVVLTPTPSHCGIVIPCLQQGFPTICEKALGRTYDEARSMVAAQAATQGFLAVTYNYSGYPMVRELRDMIRRGVLGKLMHFQAEMQQEGFRRVDAHGHKPVPQSWRLSDGPIPTLYLDLAVHLHHLVHYLTDKRPLEVAADHDSYGWFNVVDNASCLCRYTDGVKGHIWFSKSALGHRNGLRIRIYGSEASAEWFQANPEELLLSFGDGRRTTVDRAGSVAVANLPRYNRFKAGHPAGYIEAFANLYRDVADCLWQYQATGRWASDEVFGADLAAEGLGLLQAMALSSQSHTWQPVPTPAG